VRAASADTLTPLTLETRCKRTGADTVDKLPPQAWGAREPLALRRACAGVSL